MKPGAVIPIKLTETAIARAARDVMESEVRRDIADAGCAGLRLRLTPAGSKTWVLACRDRLGRMRRFPLGAFPSMGISEARSEARRLHGAVKDGADPVADRRRDRAIGKDAKAGIGTLEAVIDLYEKLRGHALRSWVHSRKRVNLVFKPLMSKPVAMMTATDLQMVADAYPAAQSAAFAVRTVRPALKWAAQRGYASAGLAVLHPPAPVQRRDRVLSRDELAALLPVLRASSRPDAAALRLMLLTLTRREEVCQARWRDIDMDGATWTLFKTDRERMTKNKQPHDIALPSQAMSLLRERRPEKPDAGALIFATKTGGPLGNWDRTTKAVQDESKTANWHRHDLRRTGATMLGEMGELPDIVEAALNHVAIRSPLAAAYNRSRYRPQVAAALQRLADALDGIEKGGGEVVPLRTQLVG